MDVRDYVWCKIFVSKLVHNTIAPIKPIPMFLAQVTYITKRKAPHDGNNMCYAQI